MSPLTPLFDIGGYRYMSIEYQVEVQEDYVCLRCKGAYDLKSAKEVFNQAYRITAQQQLNAVLIDVREIAGNPPSTMERFDLGVLIGEHRDSGICLALVGTEPILDPRRFGETVALNRGGWGKGFTDIDEAIVWLKASISKQ